VLIRKELNAYKKKQNGILLDDSWTQGNYRLWLVDEVQQDGGGTTGHG
jgi:hypothetical protein